VLEFGPAETTDYEVAVGTKQFTDVRSPPFKVVHVTEYILGPQIS